MPQERVRQALEGVYQEWAGRAELPGFRKGKVPRQVLEAQFAELARQEAAKRLVPDLYRQAVEAEALHPVSVPRVSGIQFGSDEGMTFLATVDVRPSFKVKHYKGIKVTRRPAAVTDDEVNQTLRGLQEQHAEMLPVEGRAAQEGDWLLCDLEFRAGSDVASRREQTWLALEPGKGPFPVDRLVGMRPAEERFVPYEFPKEFPEPTLAGKAGGILVKVKQVKQRRLPEIDDEFAKRFGDFANLQACKDAIRRDLARHREVEGRREIERQITGELVRRTDCDLPESLVAGQLDQLVRGSLEELRRRGVSEDDARKAEPALRERLADEARRRVKAYFILDWIAQAESIQPTDQEVADRMAAIARSTNQSPEAIRAGLEQQGRLDALREDLRHDKVVEWLVSQAEVSHG